MGHQVELAPGTTCEPCACRYRCLGALVHGSHEMTRVIHVESRAWISTVTEMVTCVEFASWAIDKSVRPQTDTHRLSEKTKNILQFDTHTRTVPQRDLFSS